MMSQNVEKKWTLKVNISKTKRSRMRTQLRDQLTLEQKETKDEWRTERNGREREWSEEEETRKKRKEKEREEK